MNQNDREQTCQCSCGNTKFTVKGTPLIRVFCHCSICQAFNDAAFSDITVFLSRDVDLHNKAQVDFKEYKSPPAVQRGKCVSCQKPAIEYLDWPLFPTLVIIPSENIAEGSFLPESSLHMFYHRRVGDINDHLPKYRGFIKSQLAFVGLLLPRMYHRLKASNH